MTTTPTEPRRFYVQLERPSSRSPGGSIIEGFERHTDTMVRVYDLEGELLASEEIAAGDDVIARRLLRKCKGRSSFYKPIEYPPWNPV